MTASTWRVRRARKGAGAVAVLTLAATSLVATTTAASPASAQGVGTDNAVTRWVEETLETVRQENVGTFPAARIYAMSTAAIYDAINGIDVREGGGREHAVVAPSGGARGDRAVAGAAAAHAVLGRTFPDQRGRLDAALQAEIEQSDASSAVIARGRTWGTIVGARVLAARAFDGAHEPDTIQTSGGLGEFHQDWDARFRNMAEFGVADASAYLHADGPPSLTSQEYADAVILSATEGAPDGDADRDELAQFWRYGDNSVRETGGWFLAALEVARQEGTTDSLSDTALLFAQLGLGTADAVTVVAIEKGQYFTWRPHFAIRNADQDGNPLTDAVHDPEWTSRFGQIGGSPEWTSGQAAFAGVGATVLAGFYGDATAFSFNTGNDAGDRSYGSFSETAEEAVFSRILQGNHFEFSLDAAFASGEVIAGEILSQRLQPVG